MKLDKEKLGERKWYQKIKEWKHEHEWAYKLIWFGFLVFGLFILIISFYASGFNVFGWVFSGKGGFVFGVIFCFLLWAGSTLVYKSIEERHHGNHEE